MLRVVIINDDTCPFLWLRFGEIKLLTRYVALLITPPHFFNTAEQGGIAPLGTRESNLKFRVNEDRKIPVSNKLRTEQENSVKNEDGVYFRFLGLNPHVRIGVIVEDFRHVPA